MQSKSHFSIAVHLCLALAYRERQGTPVTSSAHLAEGVNTNPAFVRRVLGDLIKRGLVVSQPGKNGGVSLARRPESIQLAEIYAACGEQSRLLDLHKQPTNRSCPVSCAVKGLIAEVCRDVESAAVEVMRHKSIGDLLERV